MYNQVFLCSFADFLKRNFQQFTCIMQYSGYIVGKRKHVNV